MSAIRNSDFTIANEPLEPEALKRELLNHHSGAFIAFEGWVRNHNEGQGVDLLEYSAYKPLAEKEGSRVVAEAIEKFDIVGASCAHRIGSLNLGGIAVWVGVASAHRGPGFKACQYIIDEVKARVPIWKKEHYQGGDTGWVNCHANPQTTPPNA
ncbi:MAG: molybdenum cofactor biosynthesis protein MoaE [Verrucomicrobiota bacterium]